MHSISLLFYIVYISQQTKSIFLFSHRYLNKLIQLTFQKWNSNTAPAENARERGNGPWQRHGKSH